jgi:hypothetical protein
MAEDISRSLTSCSGKYVSVSAPILSSLGVPLVNDEQDDDSRSGINPFMLETDLRWDKEPGGEPLELFLELFDLERPRGVSKAICVTGRREMVTVVESVPRDDGPM